VNNNMGIHVAQVKTVGNYLDDLRYRVEHGKPSQWQEGLQKYFKTIAYRLERAMLFHGNWEGCISEGWKRCISEGVLNRSVY
jgi:hypothetical protein